MADVNVRSILEALAREDVSLEDAELQMLRHIEDWQHEANEGMRRARNNLANALVKVVESNHKMHVPSGVKWEDCTAKTCVAAQKAFRADDLHSGSPFRQHPIATTPSSEDIGCFGCFQTFDSQEEIDAHECGETTTAAATSNTSQSRHAPIEEFAREWIRMYPYSDHGEQEILRTNADPDELREIVRQLMLVPQLAIGSHHLPGVAKMIEEAGEVLQVLGKMIAFPHGKHPDGSNPSSDLIDELGDLDAATDYFLEHSAINGKWVAKRRSKKTELFDGWHRETRALLGTDPET